MERDVLGSALVAIVVCCEECGFPVCRPCYEYERREGTQVCPQCHTRYKRIKGNWKLSY